MMVSMARACVNVCTSKGSDHRQTGIDEENNTHKHRDNIALNIANVPQLTVHTPSTEPAFVQYIHTYTYMVNMSDVVHGTRSTLYVSTRR